MYKSNASNVRAYFVKAKVTYMSSSQAGGKPWNLVRGITQRHLTGHFHSTQDFDWRIMPPLLFHMICSFSLEVSAFSCFFFNKISTALFFPGWWILSVFDPQTVKGASFFVEILGVVLENTISSALPQWQTKCVGSLAPQVSMWVFTRSSFSLTFFWNSLGWFQVG